MRDGGDGGGGGGWYQKSRCFHLMKKKGVGSRDDFQLTITFRQVN